MRITVIIGRFMVVLCAAACVAAVISGMPAGGLTAAQREAQQEAAPKADVQVDTGQGKRLTLTVQVLLSDPAKKNDHEPAEDALVHIEGTQEEPYKTDEKGLVKLSGISTDKVTLRIKVRGADICRLQDIPVIGDDQVVTVLVEKTQEGKCGFQQ